MLVTRIRFYFLSVLQKALLKEPLQVGIERFARLISFCSIWFIELVSYAALIEYICGFYRLPIWAIPLGMLVSILAGYCTMQKKTYFVFRNPIPFWRAFLVVFSRFVLIIEAFECNTTSDWLNHTVKPIRSCVTFKYTKSKRKRQKKKFLRMFVEYGPWFFFKYFKYVHTV